MTNSPPSNVKLQPGEPARVLASGIDSLVLAIDVRWIKKDFIGLIDELKLRAQMDHADQPGQLKPEDGETATWDFVVKPNGSNGYAWIVENHEMTLRIGDWTEPGSRPSVMAEIRSETLWHRGARAAIDRVKRLLEAAGADIDIVKVSRVDPCCDLLIREEEFTDAIKSQIVTRAHDVKLHDHRKVFSGISIGKGKVSARLYDKPIEIAAKSGKVWMFDIWKLDGIPDGCRIVRVEFQIRREAIKSLSINTTDDLFESLPGLWKYCSEKWLRVVDDPELHHTQQTVQPWWLVASDGFEGAQGASPLVRSISIKANLQRLVSLFVGVVASIIAMQPESEVGDGEILDFDTFFRKAARIAYARTDMNSIEFTHRVKQKRAKYAQSKPKDDGASGKPDVS